MKEMTLSPLGKTWILDLDGTIVKHNGHLHGGDVLLPGVKEFFSKISAEDKVILITAREQKYESELIKFLSSHKIVFHQILFDMPKGERILVNDAKPSGLQTAYVVNLKRDEGLNFKYTIDESL